jgi:hypothetical protein
MAGVHCRKLIEIAHIGRCEDRSGRLSTADWNGYEKSGCPVRVIIGIERIGKFTHDGVKPSEYGFCIIECKLTGQGAEAISPDPGADRDALAYRSTQTFQD